MEEHLIHCFWAFVADPFKLSLAVVSFGIAVATIFAIKRFDLSVRQKILAIYGHLAALFFPFILFIFTMACSAALPCHWSVVAINIAIATVLLALATGFVIIPFIYRQATRQVLSGPIFKMLTECAKQTKQKVPKLYLVDRAKPMAFSIKGLFSSAIFISVGLLELFNRKEREAVLLHELAHIKQRSSILKFSSSVLRTFSPLSLIAQFRQDCGRDEYDADRAVIETQGTDRYLLSAKKKIKTFIRQ